jgi:hypothetical protein
LRELSISGNLGERSPFRESTELVATGAAKFFVFFLSPFGSRWTYKIEALNKFSRLARLS